MSFAKISAKGWVVIPAELRTRYGLKPGMRVQVIDYGGVVSLIPLFKDAVKQAAGMLKGEASLTKSLLAERALESQHEQRAKGNLRS